MSESAVSSVDLDRLRRLRATVVRVDEMDLAQWWNTQGQLGAVHVARTYPREKPYGNVKVAEEDSGVPTSVNGSHVDAAQV